ncbi:TPA_exp: Uncharacterized protein A8136_0239 [Trichophyton benhamiae CBS 112371]|uniref:Uncharacterized protein n=1 Tax=Arthroderma benhamiae (strain ATCC MYA-4681 / CBS 112371) TaxID=663331 RepID=D4AIX3_ARTBC|nr:uncharacterized protein ARB_04221 [Trichophyton benhamiae CBS 112371]EFE36696.1 conserved hypothetical protein [Trichophyton benhamiae CBS 112371]DAA79466.1 TPA_exp: Uncharacterized protein A8136_0239 [Trichophyton benhamiae CBS 112371]
MFNPLPPIEPRDSHTLWYSSSYTGRSAANSSQNTTSGAQHPQPGRRNGRSQGTNTPLFSASFDPLSTLLAEERALTLRKQNIASFGFSWIRPAGFPKTMMGLREEEMECEEGAGGGLGEGDIEEEEFMEGVEGGEGGLGLDGAGEGVEGDAGMERDLDGDIPDGDGEGFGLVEEGEEGYEDEEEEFLDEEEEGMMERDLDDDVPEAPDADEEDEDEDGDEDDEEDEEDEEDRYGDTSEVRTPNNNTRTPGESNMMMERDLDGSVPDAPQEAPSQQQEWEHTDSDEDVYDEDDDEDGEEEEEEEGEGEDEGTDEGHSRLSWASLPPGYIPHLTPSGPRRETEAERLFIERWGGNDDSIDIGSSDMLPANPLSISRRRSRRHADEDSDLEEM